MRLYSIIFANFKSFAGKVEVPFGPITSLIGPSGAGKSNIVAGLERIGGLLSGIPYEPEPSDYFDNNRDSEMQLGATLELSDRERQVLLSRITNPPSGDWRNLAGNTAFKFVRYLASFRGTAKRREEISLSTGTTAFHTFVRARLGQGGYIVELADITGVNFGKKVQPTPRLYDMRKIVSSENLAEMVDPSLFPAMRRLGCGLRTVVIARGIPDRVPARDTATIGTDGQNMPNELNHLQKADQIKFDEYMMSVTHGDPLGVEPRTVGPDRVLSVRENGLTRIATHNELGSGQRQTLILGWQLLRGHDVILVIKDPDLYLHAERQRQIFRLIQDKNRHTGTQFVIETRSPAFMEGGSVGLTVLVTKNRGRSNVSYVGPEGAPTIRRMLGITHADVLGSDNILLVEGKSEGASFGAFLKSLAPDQARKTTVHVLEGANKIKNGEMLIKYIEGTEGRRAFIILDENKDALLHINRLKGHGVFQDNVCFLPKNFEDAFNDEVVAKAVVRMGNERNVRLVLSAADVSRLRRNEKDTATALGKWWSSKTESDFNKVELAKMLVTIVGGHPPPDIEKALNQAVAHFKSDGADTLG